MLRELHPERDLEPYEVISSWGGYPATLTDRVEPGLPDHSAVTLAAVEQARAVQNQNLRQGYGRKVGR